MSSLPRSGVSMTGRDAILIDLDERNFDLALQRVGPFILERAS